MISLKKKGNFKNNEKRKQIYLLFRIRCKNAWSHKFETIDIWSKSCKGKENGDKRFNLMKLVVSDGHTRSHFSHVFLCGLSLAVEAVASWNIFWQVATLHQGRSRLDILQVSLPQPLFLDIKYFSANCADTTFQDIDRKWIKWFEVLFIDRLKPRSYSTFMCVFSPSVLSIKMAVE